MEMSRLTRDGSAEPVSRGQTLKRERGQGYIHFPRSADHEQDQQPYPVDPYSCYVSDHTYITHTYKYKYNKCLMDRFTLNVINCCSYSPEGYEFSRAEECKYLSGLEHAMKNHVLLLLLTPLIGLHLKPLLTKNR